MTKILLVEDDKSLREIYGTRLLAEGYDIVSASDGEEALAVAIKEKPDLIVSDIMMPKISGFEMLDLLKSNEATRNIKVIVMTALSSDNQRQRGESLGAERYLVKSQVGIEDVVRTVHEVLGDQNGASAPVMPAPNQSPVNPPQATQPTTVVAQASTDGTTSSTTTQDPAAQAQTATTPIPQAVQQPEPVAQTPSASPPAQPTPTAPAPGAYLAEQPDADASGQQSPVDLAQSGQSIKTRVIQPTGESLSPNVDINALVAAEEAKEMGFDPSNISSSANSNAPNAVDATNSAAPSSPDAPIPNLPEIQIGADGTLVDSSMPNDTPPPVTPATPPIQTEPVTATQAPADQPAAPSNPA